MSCEISLGRFLTLIVILICKSKNVDLISHQSHLCKAKDMPCVKENGDECRMKYYKLNSTDCRDLTFNDNPRNGENELGKFQIQSYHYSMKSYKQTGFNLTFSNISWSHLKFRFKQEGNDMKNTCREFHNLGNSFVKNIFYDCLWSNENYEGKIFSFEYEAQQEEVISYKKFSFQVPYAENIEETTDLANWEIFVFVEVIKNAFGLNTFILHWQPLPKRFSINTYNLSIYSNELGQSDVIFSTNVTCSGFDDCKYYYNRWYGNVQFGVQPFCGNESKCFISKTKVFLLGEAAKPLLIGIVSVTLVIPVMIYVLYLLRSYFVRKSKKLICPVPKLLVIFTPSLSYHLNVVFSLVEYLKTYCNVEPLVGELHIFHSKSRDPFKWCNEAFKSADAVMVLTSPYHKHLRLADSVYQNMDILLLRLLRERLASREGRARFFLLMLPYCSEKDIPSEAINLRRFSFPKDLNKMLRFVHNDSTLMDCLGSAEVQGGKENYKLLGTKLSNAIAEAQSNLDKNKSEYEQMIEEMKSEGGEPLLTCPEPAPATVEKKVDECKQPPRGKRTVIEMAEEIFREFPGRLDDMNLSGEETESLMGSQKTSADRDIVNLDDLDL